jgi:hypothetical protein
MKLTLPPELAEAALFRRGVLIKLTMDFKERGAREKYAVVVSADGAADPLLLVLTTSNTKWYDEHPDAPGFVRLPAGRVKSLPKATVVNCRDLHRLPRDVVSQRYQGNVLEYCELLSADVLAEVDVALAGAITLSPSDKALVLPAAKVEDALALSSLVE